jgi:serine/threonine protein kinase
MLCSHNYSKSIDVWSAGCTFAELLSKNYLFPGDNYLAQIKLIIDLLGSPTELDLDFISNNNAKSYVANFKGIPKKPLETIVNYNNKEALDLLEKMIVFNPSRRITIQDALQHPYVAAIRDEGVVDPTFQGNINFSFD